MTKKQEIYDNLIEETKRSRDAVTKELRVLVGELQILEKKILEVKLQRNHLDTLLQFYKNQRKDEVVWLKLKCIKTKTTN